MKDNISPYIRNRVYPVEQILPLLKARSKTKGKGKEYIELDGVQVKISSQRYEILTCQSEMLSMWIRRKILCC